VAEQPALRFNVAAAMTGHSWQVQLHQPELSLCSARSASGWMFSCATYVSPWPGLSSGSGSTR
jgi:hypothetical protein